MAPQDDSGSSWQTAEHARQMSALRHTDTRKQRNTTIVSRKDSCGVGFVLKCNRLTSNQWARVGQGVRRRWKLQRLFSTFPSGPPGLGLLVLRVASGLTGTVQGSLILLGHQSSGFEPWAAGLILIGSGLLVLAGFLTPVASVVQALISIPFALSWLAPPLSNLIFPPLAPVLIAAIAAALALLGLGSLSVDSSMFGQREIVIPRAQCRKQ